MKSVPLFLCLAFINFSGLFLLTEAGCRIRRETALKCVAYTTKSEHSMISSMFSSKPESDLNKLVRFYLFTGKNPSCTQQLKLNDEDALFSSNFNPSLPVRVVIHGWENDMHSEINDLMRRAYLKRGNFNIIIVAWGDLAFDMNYFHVTKQVENIGSFVSDFLFFLHKATNVSYENIYLIGHSVGAHIAGSVGHHSPKKISTIFALDPADPLFDALPLNQRIDASDAEYVEAIHTSIKFLGIPYSVGHADFYPNYGKSQKGCEWDIKACSHSRAYEYFAESINTADGFWAVPCGNEHEMLKDEMCSPSSGESVLMGGEPAIPKKGIFYLETNSESSYSKGKLS